MELKQLDSKNRKDLDPFNQHYILCEKLCLMGTFMKFGWKVPIGMQPAALHHHFRNGVIGTQEELNFLDGPVELSYEHDLAPRARWITNPTVVKEEIKVVEESGGPEFSMENAGLLKGKKDLIAYAKLFGIKLKQASNINMKSMMKTLEEEAIELELIQ